MESLYADTFSSVPSIELHRPQPGSVLNMEAPSHTQLPQLQTQPDPFRTRQQSIASGSSNWDASASDYSFHDRAPWANTPELSNCDSPSAVLSESPFTAMPDSTFGLSRPEDLALTVDFPKTLNLDDPEFSSMFQGPPEAPEDPRYGLQMRSRRHSDVGSYNQQNPAGHDNGGHSRNSSRASATQAPAITGRSRGPTLSSGGGDPDEDEDDGATGSDAGGRRKRKRLSDGRFACPYQVFDQHLDCFHPGRRNPQGGCESIYRLRQHFKRRHRESHRCSNCWKSFEKPEEAARHPQEFRCHAKPRPEREYFMNPAQVEKVDQGIGNRSEEEFWWDTFQTLIGDVKGMDRATVKRRYSPYYSSNNINNNNHNNNSGEPPNLRGYDIANVMHQQQQEQQALMSPPQYTNPADWPPLPILDHPYMTMMDNQSVSQDTVVPHTPRDRLGSLPYGDPCFVGPQQNYVWAAGAPGGVSNNNSGGDGGAGVHADQQLQQLAGNNARAHIARIRDLVSETTAADPLPPRARERMAQISDILDRLEQSIP